MPEPSTPGPGYMTCACGEPLRRGLQDVCDQCAEEETESYGPAYCPCGAPNGNECQGCYQP